MRATLGERLRPSPGGAAGEGAGPSTAPGPAGLEAVGISAWFGATRVLADVSLSAPAATVTALIGPSGCGKSTFLRILNRMHESVPGAQMAGEVYLDGEEIYAPSYRITQARRHIGMVFQKPNPFPAMSIADNVTSGLVLAGTKIGRGERHDLVERCLQRAHLWHEVKDRLSRPGARSPAASSSGSASPGRSP